MTEVLNEDQRFCLIKRLKKSGKRNLSASDPPSTAPDRKNRQSKHIRLPGAPLRHPTRLAGEPVCWMRPADLRWTHWLSHNDSCAILHCARSP